MIVLITGASHTGKTRMAQMVLEKKLFPYVSEDHIKMGLIRSGYTRLTPLDDEKMTDFLWPIVREMIKTAVENHQNLVVEGCYVPFDWQKDFTEEYLSAIKYICLCFSDDYIDRHFADIIQNASCIERRLDDDYCSVDLIKRENRYYYEGCRRCHTEVLRIEENYTESIDRALIRLFAE